MHSLEQGDRRTFLRRIGTTSVTLLVALGLVVVGFIDFYTGVDIRVFPLYFIPLALAGQRLGPRGAILSSLAATTIWIAAMYWGGRHYPSVWIWLFNFSSQGSAFLVITLLVARNEQRLHREYELSRTDSLTGLLNSRAFLERGASVLAETLRDGQPITLAYIDLDHFKQVNDRHGHVVGDQLLEAVGRIMRDAIAGQGLVARIGGDEFAVLLPNANPQSASALLESLRRKLLDHPEIRESGVSASIGAVSHQTEGPDLATLMKKADELMYRVKAEGRNAVKVAAAIA